MADPQNLNSSSPGALSTGAPPSLSPPLAPASSAPPAAAGAPAPPTVSAGATSTPTTLAASAGPAPGTAGAAAAGAPAQPVGLAASLCCGGGGVGNAGGAGVFQGLVVQNVGQLTAALAASVQKYTEALVLSTNQIFITLDNVNWQAFS